MDIDIGCFDGVHPLGERATHSPASLRLIHAALLILEPAQPMKGAVSSKPALSP
jgi:hypothetical protein